MNPYRVLKVPRSADLAAITAAYRKASKCCHPDLHPGDAKAAERFKLVQAAFDVLRDPARRAQYDRDGTVDQRGLGANQTHEQAVRLLHETLHKLLGKMFRQDADPRVQDVLGLLRKRVAKEIDRMDEAVKTQERVNRLLADVAERFTAADSILASSARQPLNDLVANLEKLRGEAVVARAAYDLLKAEVYRCDERSGAVASWSDRRSFVLPAGLDKYLFGGDDDGDE